MEVDGFHLRAAPATSSAHERVLVPTEFGTQQRGRYPRKRNKARELCQQIYTELTV